MNAQRIKPQPPAFWTKVANDFEKDGNIPAAIKAWWTAAAVSIGHNRTARYENQGNELANKVGISRGPRYFSDQEKWEIYKQYGITQ